MSEPKNSGSAIEIGENGDGKGKGMRVDPGFKLFGKTIPVCHSSEMDAKANGDTACENSKDEEVQGNTVSKAESDEGNSNDGEGKPALKKPDKLLPCPRCESMDTKFCYYNNYNVNQPRHFCKKCQRYWTAGGTLRNVPVGAGRRKNKHSASVSAYRHVVSSEGGLAVRTEDPEGDRVVIPCALPAPCLRPLKIGNSRIQVVPVEAFESTGAVLKFGGGREADAPIEWQSREDDSCAGSSSITGSASGEKEAGRVNCGQGPHSDRGGSSQFGLKVGCVRGLNGGSPVPFYGGPWSYGWRFGYASPSWNGPGWAGVPWAVDSGSFLGPAAAGWGPGSWVASSSPNSSDSGSPSLGKHSRERSQPDCKTDGCLWVPKTLRIDDPGEAAKSSIWTTLGLENKSQSTITGGGIFKAFQPKTAEGMKGSIKAPAPPQVVHVNPAAFSRSVAFQESS